MLELIELCKSYGEFEFGPVSFTVGSEVLSILGPSGSGKTTLLALTAGIIPPDHGSVTLDGRSLDGCSVEERGTGLVFQDGALFPHMTSRENIDYAATDSKQTEELAARFEITDVLDRQPQSLSGGERQRVALARSLAADPDAMLLDEPLSSLDPPIRDRLREELHTLFASLDIPVLYVTHDRRTATALGDRVAVFRDGEVEQIGQAETVMQRPETPFVARFTGSENLFEATVAESETDRTVLRVGECLFRTVTSSLSTESVRICIHPSRVQLRPVDNASTPTQNVLTGVVKRYLNERTHYRVQIEPSAIPGELTATVQPPDFRSLAIEQGASVAIHIPASAIHIID